MDWQSISRLDWVQPAALTRSYELRLDQRPAGSLEFENAFGSRAFARINGGRWTFKRSGFFSTRVTAREADSDREIAVYEPSWGLSKGALQLASGERLEFRASNFWNTAWSLSGANGVLLELHSHGVMHHGCTVDLSEAGRNQGQAPLLAALCWYILLLHMADAAAVVAAT